MMDIDYVQRKYPFSILIVSKTNSARSIMLEAVLNQLKEKYFYVYSAGVQPAGEVHPLALEQLQLAGYPTENLRSKSLDEFLAPDAIHIDYTMTACEQMAAEHREIFGRFIDCHWGFIEDPTLVQGSDEEKRAAFAHTLFHIEKRVKCLISLSIAELDFSFMLGYLLAVGELPLEEILTLQLKP